MDIKAAFCRESRQKEIFISQPNEAKTKKELLATECVKSRYDDAIFHWHKENTLQGILAAHVDDFCWAGTKLIQNIVSSHT